MLLFYVFILCQMIIHEVTGLICVECNTFKFRSASAKIQNSGLIDLLKYDASCDTGKGDEPVTTCPNYAHNNTMCVKAQYLVTSIRQDYEFVAETVDRFCVNTERNKTCTSVQEIIDVEFDEMLLTNYFNESFRHMLTIDGKACLCSSDHCNGFGGASRMVETLPKCYLLVLLLCYFYL